MLFNSYLYIFIFLPVVYLGFLGLARYTSYKWVVGWLVAASLFFYGWWNPVYLALLGTSILVNYGLGQSLQKMTGDLRKPLMLTGVLFNVGLLAYFKYANFFVDTVEQAVGREFTFSKIALPLAISFITFQKIAFLMDVYRRKIVMSDFLTFCLFVVFFPQLIAGPIVHYAQIVPQIQKRLMVSNRVRELAMGASLFVLGLAKKVLIADNLATFANPVFAAANSGAVIQSFDAWMGALAYTFQLYFDFSGYADMAIGAALIFGIKLPINFLSPYKATSIIDFWRRWHISLSNFLRDYVYFSLGGNRHGELKKLTAIFITMFIGGVWHGAGWTFILWGALQGSYLVINHLWRRHGLVLKGRAWWIFAHVLTFLCVVFGWVLFRADGTESATLIMKSMVGIVPEGAKTEYVESAALYWVIGSYLVCMLLPSTMEYFRMAMQKDNGSLFLGRLKFRPRFMTAFVFAAIFVVCIANMGKISEFLYFQF